MDKVEEPVQAVLEAATDPSEQNFAVDERHPDMPEVVIGTETMHADEAGNSSWSQWTWNAELGLYIIFYEECYHTWDPETQEYGKYSTGEEDGNQRDEEDSHDSGGDDNAEIDGEPMSDSELDGEPLDDCDDFKEGVRFRCIVQLRALLPPVVVRVCLDGDFHLLSFL